MKIKCFVLVILFQTAVFAQKRVAIVGAGIAGVATAHYIKASDPNAAVTVFEKNDEIGGNAHTIATTNALGDTLFVDAGPQYFADKSWENYIAFLKLYNEYNEAETYSFKGSIVLQQNANTRPNLVTPYKGKFRGESLTTLIRFKRIFDWGFAIFSGKNKNYPATIGEWVKAMPFDEHFKTNTIIPFLAADLGTSTDEIAQASTAEMVKLFAFRKATGSAEFKIMKKGMGTLVQHIGEKLQAQGVVFKLSSPVIRVESNGAQYTLFYENEKSIHHEEFDYVIFATHPYQAGKILQQNKDCEKLVKVLNDFQYFKAHILLHRYSEIVDKNYPSFFNIHIDEKTKMISNTMDLGVIHPRYKGIYKSWVSDDVYAKIKANHLMIHEELFYHPLITPFFVDNIAKMKTMVKEFKGLDFAGGWSQGLETQETAILSGMEAARQYMIWKNK